MLTNTVAQVHTKTFVATITQSEVNFVGAATTTRLLKPFEI